MGSELGSYANRKFRFTAVTAKCFMVPVLDVILTPQYANCAGHGVGAWSTEWHWEADPTTAGHGHF